MFSHLRRSCINRQPALPLKDSNKVLVILTTLKYLLLVYSSEYSMIDLELAFLTCLTCHIIFYYLTLYYINETNGTCPQ